jgi:hypothetical protein
MGTNVGWFFEFLKNFQFYFFNSKFKNHQFWFFENFQSQRTFFFSVLNFFNPFWFLFGLVVLWPKNKQLYTIIFKDKKPNQLNIMNMIFYWLWTRILIVMKVFFEPSYCIVWEGFQLQTYAIFPHGFPFLHIASLTLTSYYFYTLVRSIHQMQKYQFWY